ncbi:type II toxin-antitoxin system VapC family toxin [Methylomagnum sp.]
MARYLDTSVLVPLYVEESRSSDVERWLAGLGSMPLMVSPWCVTEFSSALGLKARRGELSGTDLAKAVAGFRRFAGQRARMVEVVAQDFYRAGELCDRWQLGLRAGDALHLAVSERRGLTVCTLDRGMWTAAQALGLTFETF